MKPRGLSDEHIRLVAIFIWEEKEKYDATSGDGQSASLNTLAALPAQYTACSCWGTDPRYERAVAM